MKANIYDITTLNAEILEMNTENEVISNNNVILNKELTKQKGELETHNSDRDKLIASKQQIDAKILSVNESSLDLEIKTLISTGVTNKVSIAKFDVDITEVGEVNFEEELDFNLTKERNELTVKKGSIEDSIAKLVKTNENLKNSENY